MQVKLYIFLRYLEGFEYYPDVLKLKKIQFLYPLRSIFRILNLSSNLKKFYLNFIAQQNPKSYLLTHDFKIIFKKSDIYPFKKGKFEGHQFSIMNKPKKFLDNLYGKNHMTEFPPEEERISVHTDLSKIEV